MAGVKTSRLPKKKRIGKCSEWFALKKFTDFYLILKPTHQNAPSIDTFPGKSNLLRRSRQVMTEFCYLLEGPEDVKTEKNGKGGKNKKEKGGGGTQVRGTTVNQLEDS